MQIDKERLELTQVVLRDEDSVTFWAKDSDKKNGCWYITTGKIGEFGKEDEEGNADYDRRYPDSFLEWAEGKDLKAETTIYRPEGGYDTENFDDWDHLARYIGVSDLVVVSTKIPKTVAKKFKYYATRSTDVSTTLRSLIYKYVKDEIIENAERDLFRD